MSSTFETVAGIIAETCDIEPDTIKAESHAINDLGIDSLDFLDVAYAIDKAFGIKREPGLNELVTGAGSACAFDPLSAWVKVAVL